jgi:adenine-specific DNA-methyltransferase
VKAPSAAQLRQHILDQVPADGSRIGNASLLDAVEQALQANSQTLDEDAFAAAREQLIADGVLAKGRGRGGSLYRTQAVASARTTSAKQAPDSTDASALTGAGNVKYSSYQHGVEATLRPEVGFQDQFQQVREPKKYRYDSSVAPELTWDENAEREFAEWLLNLITQAGERGEAKVFAQPQKWQGTGEAFHSTHECVARIKSLTQPFLNWAGKAERREISVPTVPLFVHERQSTRAILEKLQTFKAAGQTDDLFGDPQLDIADRLDAYEHKGPWTNRLILGDSLQVMNSLLEYEGLGGQVQMIYIDPPYGVKFGSNFQPFVRKRTVTHGQDDEMIREPEMVKAYRDTWELGLHSYLSYLRDRLLLAKELLTDSGSVFVQISDENLHHVREVLDEVFGGSNFVSQISFQTTSGFESNTLATLGDFLLWYAKDKGRVTYNSLYYPQRADPGYGNATWVLLPDGTSRGVTAQEKRGEQPIPERARLYKPDNIKSQGAASSPQPFEFNGKTYTPGENSHWKASFPEGMERLAKAKRIHVATNSIQYIRYHDDFAFQAFGSIWTDTRTGNFTEKKAYVVQTSPKVIERCMLMTTNPGDLVFDPTCGSGTTSFVAEQWGRRWITCDTSRVPLALARQRLLTATFPWYDLAEPKKGPAGNFVYIRKQNRKGEETGGLVPHITLKSIANDEEPTMEKLVDRPEINSRITRVCGPFAVEATIQAAAILDEQATGGGSVQDNPRAYLDRMIEVLRRAHTLRLPENQTLALGSVRPVADCEWLHAEAETEANGHASQRVAVAFGPEDGAISSRMVYDAASEARYLHYDQLYLFGFAIEAKALELVHDRAKLRIPVSYVAVTPDVVMADLLKTSHTDQIFSITGLPDIHLTHAGKRDDGTPLYNVEVRGLDIFNPADLETKSVDADNLPCWMLDTDYNGRVFCASQVFFPRTAAWDNLQRSLRADFDPSVWEHLAGTTSEAFAMGKEQRIAVKVIDERGNELMAVRSIDEVEK